MSRLVFFTILLFSCYTGFCQNEKTCKIPFYKNTASILEVDIKINNYLQRFIFDPGASLVSFSKIFYDKLYKNGYINSSDIKYRTKTRLADGTLANAFAITLKKIDLGDFEINNIEALVLENNQAPFLIGQNLLQKFSSFSVDNSRNQLIFKKILPISCTISSIRYIPCTKDAISEINVIRDILNEDKNININSDSIEENIPTNMVASGKIVSKITVRYFDVNDLILANALKIRLEDTGYKESEILIEDMTIYYSNPIPSYLEIWIK